MQVPKTLRNALVMIRKTTLADAILSKDIELIKRSVFVAACVTVRFFY